jgi:hypothetical protein
MKIRFPKTLKRSLLAAVVFTGIVTAPQLQANSQATRSSSGSISTTTQFAQTQRVRDTVVAVESVGMTVSDMDRSVDFYTKVLSFFPLVKAIQNGKNQPIFRRLKLTIRAQK